MAGLIEADYGWWGLYVTEGRLVRRPVVTWAQNEAGDVEAWCATPDGVVLVEVGVGECIALICPQGRYGDNAWSEEDEEVDLRARELLRVQMGRGDDDEEELDDE